MLQWTPLAVRTGDARGFALRHVDPEIAPFLAEAGIYLCQFPPNPVRPGDSWSGSTTATGGCTSARYRYRGMERGRALFELTDIRMSSHEQIGPMTMTVDPAAGIPVRVEYRVRGRQTGRISRFVQVLVREEG
ncbi:MAG: hypothetical protein KIS66_00410 [Fimbriimonadaceae bacterium]|nr:hypothetical protein [Fimbriimonadaceae bacterium]